MVNTTLKRKQPIRSAKIKTTTKRSSPVRGMIGLREKPDYLVLNCGGNICLYNSSTKTMERLTSRSASKIPPGAKITIKQNGMSRVQVASVIDAIYGSSKVKTTG